MYNAMTQAFANIGFDVSKQKKFQQGWSTKLSYRTYQELVKQDIPVAGK